VRIGKGKGEVGDGREGEGKEEMCNRNFQLFKALQSPRVTSYATKFLARDSICAERAIYYRPFICPSVCLSVRPTHGWISKNG